MAWIITNESEIFICNSVGFIDLFKLGKVVADFSLIHIQVAFLSSQAHCKARA